jgi:transcriptional regulator with XRE-family HTH domain
MITDAGLTGNQVKAFRESLGEGQLVFSRRIAASQPTIWRLEQKGDELVRSPETLLITRIAAEVGFTFPEIAQ